jgi:hypothetical protein
MCFDGFVVIGEEYAAGVKELGATFAKSVISLVLLSSNAELDRGYLAESGIIGKNTPIVSCRDVLEGKGVPNGNFIVALPARGEEGGKIDAAGKIRLATVRKLVSQIPGALVMTSVPSESGMVTDDCVGVAISASNMRPIPQSLKRKSEISVYPAGDAGFGGFAETVKAVASSVCALENLRKTVIYTVTSQTARLVCTLLAIIIDVPLMNAANILLLGMIFDFLAILVLSFTPERCTVPDGSDERKQIPSVKVLSKQVLIGLVAGITVFMSVTLSSHFTGVDIGLGKGMISASTIALILCQLVLLSEIIIDGTALFRAGSSNVAYFVYAVISLLTVLLLTFSVGVSLFVGDVNPSWIVSTVSAASSFVILGVYELVKMAVHRKTDKK